MERCKPVLDVLRRRSEALWKPMESTQAGWGSEKHPSEQGGRASLADGKEYSRAREEPQHGKCGSQQEVQDSQDVNLRGHLRPGKGSCCSVRQHWGP